MKKIVLIPAYQPTNIFIELVKELKQCEFDIIVVNDGSSKKCYNIFKKIQSYATVLNHEKNKGQGAALKTGLRYIKDTLNEDATIVMMDCDGQHKIEDAEKLCKYSEENPHVLVLGKRLRNEKMPIRSKFGNAITSFIYKVVTNTNVYDTQTGLRAINSNLIDYMIDVEKDGFEYQINVLLNFVKNKIQIHEIEIETIYIAKNAGSHFKFLKDSFKIYKEIIKFSLSSLISFLVDYGLYAILILITNNIIVSNIIARIVSATVNYKINKKAVFNDKKTAKSAIKYIILAISILCLNTIILKLLADYLFINKYLSKVITELTLFILSYIIQRRYVFKK